jgi:hypothetical protein
MAVRRVFLLLAAGLVCGCGAAEDSGDRVAEAAKRTADERSYRLHFDMRFEGIREASGPVRVTGEGAFDHERQRGRIRVEIPTVADEPGGVEEILYVGTDSYTREGDGWLKEENTEFAEDLSDFGPLALSPARAIELIGTLTKDVEYVGTRDQLEHYRARVSTSRLIDPGEPEEPELGTSVLDLWLDGDSRLRRMHWSATLPDDETIIDLETTLEFSDFGLEVDVEPPPEADIVTEEVGSYDEEAALEEGACAGATHPLAVADVQRVLEKHGLGATAYCTPEKTTFLISYEDEAVTCEVARSPGEFSRDTEEGALTAKNVRCFELAMLTGGEPSDRLRDVMAELEESG